MGFYGNLLEVADDKEPINKKLKIFREKTRSGVVEKIIDNYTLLIKDLFKKETNINLFLNREVVLKLTGNVGKI